MSIEDPSKSPPPTEQPEQQLREEEASFGGLAEV